MQTTISIKIPAELKPIYDRLSRDKKEFIKMVVIALIAGLGNTDIPEFTTGSKRIEVKLEVGDRMAELMERLSGLCLSKEKVRRIRELIDKYKGEKDVHLTADTVARLLEGLLE